jgi:hypothetical protein
MLVVMRVIVRRMSVRPVIMVMSAAGRTCMRMGVVFVMAVVVCMIGMRCMAMSMVVPVPVPVIVIVIVMCMGLSIKRRMQGLVDNFQ